MKHMTIANTPAKPLGPIQELTRDINELRKSGKKDAFCLNTTGTPPKITADELRRMLAAASHSKTYQKNSEKYQFTLVTRKGQQVLRLKQQGWFSNVIGRFGISHDKRETQRAEAAKLIQETLAQNDLDMDSKVDISGPTLSKAKAKSLQRDIMTKSGLAPHQPKRDEIYTMKQLADAEPESRASQGEEVEFDDTHKSYTAYNQENDTPKATARPQHDSMNSSSDSDLNYLKFQPAHKDAYDDEDPRGSWPQRSLINPRVSGDVELPNHLFRFQHARVGSMDSDNPYDAMLKHLLKNH